MSNPRADHTGRRYGSLVAVRPTGATYRRAAIWLLRCDCGGEREVVPSWLGSQMRAGRAPGCAGCSPRSYRVRTRRPVDAPLSGARLTTRQAERAGPWRILDRNTGKPYILVDYPDGATCRDELAALLQPYPSGHYWRRRLQATPAAAMGARPALALDMATA